MDRVCANTTVCDNDYAGINYPALRAGKIPAHTLRLPTEYETIAPTASSDRTCNQVEVCKNTSDTTNITMNGPASYEEVAPDYDTDRVCSALTICNITTEFMASRPTAFKDRACKTLTTCNETEYEINWPARLETLSDRICWPITVCDSTEFEAQEPTTTTDRICLSRGICGGPSPAVSCGASGCGQYVSHAGSVSRAGRDQPQVTATPPTCTNVSESCSFPTEYEVAAPGLVVDRVCTAMRACEPIYEYETMAGTPTSDKECESVLECNVGTEWETAASTETSNSQCATLSNCSDVGVEYEAAAPTATSDRVCKAVTTCAFRVTDDKPYPTGADLEGYAIPTFELEAPTATTDRMCQEVAICSDWGAQYYKADTDDYAIFKTGGMSNSNDDWVGLIEGLGVTEAIPKDNARSRGMSDAMFDEFDGNNDAELDLVEVERLSAAVQAGNVSTKAIAWPTGPKNKLNLSVDEALFFTAARPTATSDRVRVLGPLVGGRGQRQRVDLETGSPGHALAASSKCALLFWLVAARRCAGS